MAAKNAAENITMVLYPNDASENGKELRLRQQYFLASASLQDVLRALGAACTATTSASFAEKNCFQLNDTHPSCAVPELMRLLMDEHGLEWDRGLGASPAGPWPTPTTPCCPRRWSDGRCACSANCCRASWRSSTRSTPASWPRWRAAGRATSERLARMSLIEEGPEPQVRMAYLAIVGSFSVNGVAALHSELLQAGPVPRLLSSSGRDKFNNKTNGVTQRRWLAAATPAWRGLITETIGDGWVTDLRRSARSRRRMPTTPPSGSAGTRSSGPTRSAWPSWCGATAAWTSIRTPCSTSRSSASTSTSASCSTSCTSSTSTTASSDGDTADWTPRCVLIGGKAAPGYFMAKRIIKLINNVAEVVNGDAEVDGRLKVAFLPNYRVSAMEIIAPGTDLSEQISTAGKEASGTGNMKFMMNGAVTIGTLDGANIEIREEVGDDNFFLFGLTAAKRWRHARGTTIPTRIIAGDADLQRVMALLESGHFNQFEPGLFDAIIDAIRSPHDPWMVAADFRGFVDAQERAAAAYRDRERWTRMSILNTARSGKFSTDRTMAEYNAEIWRLTPVAPIPQAAGQ